MSAMASRIAHPNLPAKTRWAGRVALHRTVLHAHPKVLCNSIHKAGTHLLVGAVSGMPGLHHYGRAAYWHYLARTGVGERRTPTPIEVKRRLAGCLPGEIFRGHVAHHPTISWSLQAAGFKHLLIYRDPRDVVVSQFFWWKRMERNGYWPYRYFRSLDSDDDRLTFLIDGWPVALADDRFPSSVRYPDIGARYAEFLPWLSDPDCLAVRFEDLVALGSRLDAYRRISDYLFPDAPPELIDAALPRMAGSADPTRSKTFRKGQAGEWRRHLSKMHVDHLKESAGQILIALDYEEGLDW